MTVALPLAFRPDFKERLLFWAQEQPDAPFLIDVLNGRQVTYRAALGLIAGLVDRWGPGTHTIVLRTPPGIVNAAIWLAALSGGHTLIPLSPEAPWPEVQRIVDRFHPDLFVSDRPDDQIGEAERLWSDQILALLEAGTPSAHPLGSAGMASGQALLQTSGTSGAPKWVRLGAARLAWTAEIIYQHHQLTRADRGLSLLPYFHVNAPVVSLGATLMAGASLVIAPRFSRSHFWSWIETYAVHWVSAVPTIIARLLETQAPAPICAQLRFIRSASAPLPAADMLAFEQRFGVPVVESYGLSEACSQVCANPVPPGRRTPGAVGSPVGVELRIALAEGPRAGEPIPVPDSVVGEICVQGASVIQQYLDDADSQSFQHGWFRTGDLGRWDDQGNVIIVGRSRDCINRGGEILAPRAIEEILCAFPKVRDVAIVGQPDRDYGEVPIAFCHAHEPWSAHLEAELRSFAHERLAPSEIPVAFYPIAALPRTASGKLLRSRLREQMPYAAMER